jgi:predicted acylesterase/phospholipase RssA
MTLVLCGGGITGAMYEFGALQALDHAFGGRFSVTDFDIFVGTSAGAIVAALLANGIHPGDVGRSIVLNADDPLNFRQEDIARLDWRELRASFLRALRMLPALFRYRRQHRKEFTVAHLLNALEENMPPGMYSLEGYRAYVRALLTRPGCSDDFELLARELYIPAVHLDTGDQVLFGSTGWRRQPISDAIAASSALPLFFQPFNLGGLDFVDGGIGQVVNLDHPIERGSRFAVVINPVIPIRNERGQVRIPTFAGHCARLRDKGVTFIVDQAQRISYRQRFLLGLERVRARCPEARLLVIEPPLDDSALFMENILNYGSRVAMLEYGYRSTARLLRSRFEEFRDGFAATGVEMSLDTLREENPWSDRLRPA